MRRVTESRGPCKVIVDYINEPPDPAPTLINGYQLLKIGYTVKGSCYTMPGRWTIKYDGCDWWMECHGKVESFEQVKEILGL